MICFERQCATASRSRLTDISPFALITDWQRWVQSPTPEAARVDRRPNRAVDGQACPHVRERSQRSSTLLALLRFKLAALGQGKPPFATLGCARYQGLVTPRRWLPVPIFLLAAMITHPTWAGLSARLIYLRSGNAERCPDQAALKKAVARRLGYDPFLLAAPHMIVAELSGTDTELHARARLLDESGIVLGNRELSGKSSECAELVASLALAISLTLDPMSVADGQEPETLETSANHDVDQALPPVAPRAEPVSKPGPPLGRTAPATAPSQTPAATSLSARIALLGAFGWVPSASPGAELGVLVRQQDLSLGLDFTAILAQKRTNAAGLSAEVSLVHLTLSPCWWIGGLGACAIGTLGRYSGSGGGVDTPQNGSHWHASSGARLQTLLPLSSRWALGMHADGVRIWTRPEFMVAGQQVFRPAAGAANLGVFASWQVL